MRIILKLLLSSFVLTLSTFSFAFFCPTNFNQIDFGNTIDQVIQQCGKPDIQTETKKENENVPQEWSYFIPQTVSLSSMTKGQGTLRTQVTFDASGKAINISVNGLGVGATEICGSSISLGDSRDAIRSACGDPSFINKQTTPTSGAPPPPDTKVTTFIYNTTPPIKIIFENGKLTSRE